MSTKLEIDRELVDYLDNLIEEILLHSSGERIEAILKAASKCEKEFQFASECSVIKNELQLALGTIHRIAEGIRQSLDVGARKSRVERFPKFKSFCTNFRILLADLLDSNRNAHYYVDVEEYERFKEWKSRN